jgi:hypothetical protein
MFWSARQQSDQRIDHYVADKMNPGGIDSLAEQIVVPVEGRSKEKIGELIREQAIDFFGHGAVAGAQPGFDMADADFKLGTNQSSGDGGVHVPVNKNEIRTSLLQDGFDGGHHTGSLLGVAAGADIEIAIRERHL